MQYAEYRNNKHLRMETETVAPGNPTSCANIVGKIPLKIVMSTQVKEYNGEEVNTWLTDYTLGSVLTT